MEKDRSYEILAFLNGSLPKTAYELLVAEIAENPNLSKEVETYRTLLAGLQESGRSALTKQVMSWDAELGALPSEAEDAVKNTEKPSNRRKNRFLPPLLLFLSAALIFLVIVVGILTPDKNQKLVDEYFVPFKEAGSSLSGLDPSSNEFAEAMYFYSNEHYVKAIKYLTPLHDSDPKNDSLNCYLGSSWLAIGKGAKALPYFEAISIEANTTSPAAELSSLAEFADWYTALAQLESGELESAQKTLNRISKNPNHWFTEESKSLKRDLSE